MESLNLQVVAVLMPLNTQHHTVPHLKALTCNIDVEVDVDVAVLSSSATLL